MKNIIIASVALLALGITACKDNPKQDETNKNLLPTSLADNPRTADGMDSTALLTMPTMDFKDTVHDFANMVEGAVVDYDFEFTNNGKNPLIISNATGSCGCTVPNYPREPIPPGKTGKLHVQFHSAGKFGHQEKSVTIQTNSNKGIHRLYIKADIKGK